MSALTWAVAAVVTDDAGRVLLCRQGRGERRHALPGGRLRPAESPAHAVVRDIRAETGWEVEVVDLVGLYHLVAPCAPSPTGHPPSLPPDVLVHVFRAVVRGPGPSGGPVGGCRVSWHDPAALPEALTPTTRAALADALAGRSGVLRHAARAETAPTSPAGTTPAPPTPTPDTDAPPRPTPGTDAPLWTAPTGHPPGQRVEPPTDRVAHP
ncbi:NUDIX hydrolase [Micromonospora sp. NPDC047670]|uniref:NUDIX hydrolase n=1 Tax=Micromonospora sp. NPDC047670 TaxID=3364252 RepID=UPI00371D30A3